MEIDFNNYEWAGVGDIELSQSPAKRPNLEVLSSDARMSMTRGFSELPNQIKPTIFNLQV
jgi:hypothetical protein